MNPRLIHCDDLFQVGLFFLLPEVFREQRLILFFLFAVLRLISVLFTLPLHYLLLANFHTTLSVFLGVDDLRLLGHGALISVAKEYDAIFFQAQILVLLTLALCLVVESLLWRYFRRRFEAFPPCRYLCQVALKSLCSAGLRTFLLTCLLIRSLDHSLLRLILRLADDV